MSSVRGDPAPAARQSLAIGLHALARRCRDAGRWQRAAAAMIAGGASVLAMAPFFLSPVLFVTLPMLVWLIDGARQGNDAPRWALLSVFGTGWWFGFGYFLLGLFWVAEAFLVEAERFLWALPFAITLLPAGLALFFGAAAVIAAKASRQGIETVLALALTMSAAEWLRGHILTGFPWNTLGYALTHPLPLMQAAAVFGIYGLTLLTVLIFAAPAVLWADARQRKYAALVIAIGPLAVLAAAGSARLTATDPVVDGVRLRIVQPSVPQREKWRPENQRSIFLEHIALSGQDQSGLAVGLTGVTHVVWPEAAMPFRPLDSQDALAAIGEMLPPDTYLISGALRLTDASAAVAPGAPIREARNSLMVFDAVGGLASLYDKIHLVPFGEYLPFKTVLEKIGLEQLVRQRGGFGAGAGPRPLLQVPGLPLVSPLICYEAIFPGAIVQGRERPGVLINLTNDGWFGNTTGPRQHLHQVRVRAVEEGLPVVRAANNGISAVIAPSGRIVGQLGLNVRGVIDAKLPQAIMPTYYSKFGDFIFAAGWAACALALFWLRQQPR